MKLLKMENTVYGLKNTLDGIKGRLVTAEEEISDIEDKAMQA